MDETIQALDDHTAVRILTTIARPHIEVSRTQTELVQDHRDALITGFNIRELLPHTSDGAMARHALMLLARDEQMQAIIKTLTESSKSQRFADPLAAAGLIAAIVFVLKTGIDFSRNETGKWSIRIKSDALDKELLKGFVEKLLSWLPSGPFE